MSDAVQAGIVSTTVTDVHERLLSQEHVARYDKGTEALDLTQFIDQEWMIEWLEEHPNLVPVGASAADVVIEYLLVDKGLVAVEVSRVVMCHVEANPARRLHVVREAHERRETELRRQRQERLHQQATLSFVAPSIAS